MRQPKDPKFITVILKYTPIFMTVLWSTLIINHMSRGLNWMPLTIMLLPLIGLIITTNKETK